MLKIIIPENEMFDEATESFIQTKKEILHLEHSLVSLSKWESKWRKPFLSETPRTTEETIDYIRHMTITQNVADDVYYRIPVKVFDEINKYIDEPMTATWFSDTNNKKSKDIITSEIIYYWMIAQNIPMECQKWHLNRLLTLIRVCNIKNAPEKKMGRKEMLNSRAALNEARKAQHQTKG